VVVAVKTVVRAAREPLRGMGDVAGDDEAASDRYPRTPMSMALTTTRTPRMVDRRRRAATRAGSL
jgi:hypothetical protein